MNNMVGSSFCLDNYILVYFLLFLVLSFMQRIDYEMIIDVDVIMNRFKREGKL